MAAFFIHERRNSEVKRVCSNCKWLEHIVFSSDFVCTNENSDYADCPCEEIDTDTCDEFEEREEK